MNKEEFIDKWNMCDDKTTPESKSYERRMRKDLDLLYQAEQDRIIRIIKGRLLIKKIRDSIIRLIKNPEV